MQPFRHNIGVWPTDCLHRRTYIYRKQVAPLLCLTTRICFTIFIPFITSVNCYKTDRCQTEPVLVFWSHSMRVEYHRQTIRDTPLSRSRGVVLPPPDSIVTVDNSLQNRVNSITLCITFNAKTGKIGLVLVKLCIQIEWLLCNVRLVWNCPTVFIDRRLNGVGLLFCSL